jgi:hypothetical protein
VSPRAQDTYDNEGVLVGVLLNALAIRDQITAGIQMSDREIETSERIFQEAERRMTIAQETRNRQAIYEARAPLDKARSDRKKLKQARDRLGLAKTRAEKMSAAVRDLLVSGQGQRSDYPMAGLILLHSGKAKLLRKNGDQVTLDVTSPGFLGPGDEIMTPGGSRADLLVLDGRAAVLVDEHTRFQLEEVSPQGQVLRIDQGKAYCAVDKPDDFAAMLQGSGGYVEADPDLKEAVARNLDQVKRLLDKKFTLRTASACCSVNGAKFTVELRKSGETEITALEGEVDAADAECSNAALVGEGLKVRVTKEGISEPQTAADVDKWWEK